MYPKNYFKITLVGDTVVFKNVNKTNFEPVVIPAGKFDYRAVKLLGR